MNAQSQDSEISSAVIRRKLGRTDLEVSALGLGTYRFDAARPELAVALDAAIRAGVRLIDTAPSYGDGAAERIIGERAGERVGGERVGTDAGRLPARPVIVSKAGVLSGGSLRRAVERGQGGRPYENTVRIRDGLWHCLDPAFLGDEISGSLERLGRERIDVLLLQNPEYLFMAGGNPVWCEERVRAAFEHLESEVEAGRIGWYGVSSNTLLGDEDDQGSLPLGRLLRAAEAASARHHFAVLEFPFNLFESDAALLRRFDGASLLGFARERGLGTLLNRPFSAFDGRRMIRLAELPATGDLQGLADAQDTGALIERAAEKVGRLHELEAALPPSASHLAQSMSWGMHLEQTLEWLRDWASWREFRESRVAPTLEGMMEIHGLNPDPEFREWFERYCTAIGEAVEAVELRFLAEADALTKRITARLDELCPELSSTPRLPAKLVRLYASLAGADCVLAGMTRPQHVETLSAALAGPKALISADEALSVIRAIRS